MLCFVLLTQYVIESYSRINKIARRALYPLPAARIPVVYITSRSNVRTPKPHAQNLMRGRGGRWRGSYCIAFEGQRKEGKLGYLYAFVATLGMG